MFRSVYIAAGVVVAVVLSLFMWSVLRPTPPSRVRTPSPVPAPLVHTPEDAAADVDTRLPEIPVAEPSIPSLPPEDALDAPPPSLGGPLDVPVAPAVRRSEPAPAATRVTGIARAQFTREVRSREPVDNITRLGRDARKVFFFTDVQHHQGETVVHRWLYGDRVMAEVPLAIGGPRWRTWSSKNLMSEWRGRWRVQVIDQGGQVLAEREFLYGE